MNGSSPGGGDYIARLMLSIKSSEVGFSHSGSKPSSQQLNRRTIHDLENNHPARLIQKKTFIVFVMIGETYMIDPRYHTSSLSFQLCLGTNGYDAKSATTNLSKPQTPIRLGPNMPCYLFFDKAKPCLALQFEIEDLRYFMYCKNFLRNSVRELVK